MACWAEHVGVGSVPAAALLLCPDFQHKRASLASCIRDTSIDRLNTSYITPTALAFDTLLSVPFKPVFMGGSRSLRTRSCRAALVLTVVIALVASLASARAPAINRRSVLPIYGPHLPLNAEEAVLHVVYPKDPANKSQTDAITKLLNDFVQDEKKIYASESKYLGIFFWSAPLTKSQAAIVKANPNVSRKGSSG